MEDAWVNVAGDEVTYCFISVLVNLLECQRVLECQHFHFPQAPSLKKRRRVRRLLLSQSLKCSRRLSASWQR